MPRSRPLRAGSLRKVGATMTRSEVLVLIPPAWRPAACPESLWRTWADGRDRRSGAPRGGGRHRPRGGRHRCGRDRRGGARRGLRSGDDTGLITPPASDRIFEALQVLDPAGAVRIVVNVQGDLPTIAPQTIRAALAPLTETPADIATLAAVITEPHERTDPMWSRWWARRWPPIACGRSISPAPPRPSARGRSITTSGFMPIAARRWSASWRCRPRRWNSARSWSSCAPWRRDAHRRGGGGCGAAWRRYPRTSGPRRALLAAEAPSGEQA